MESSGSPALTLVVENGPRKGEIVECLPGSRVRIGRIVRGNTFTIKDPSISQSHVSIECAGGGGGGRSPTSTVPTAPSSTASRSSHSSPPSSAAATQSRSGSIRRSTSRSVRRNGGALSGEAAPPAPCGSRRRWRKIQRQGGRRKAGASASRRGRPPRNPATRVLNPSPRSLRSRTLRIPLLSRESKLESGWQEWHCVPRRRQSGACCGDGGGNPSVDMERMTLEEWFHRMENHLPKVIHGVAEQVIADIRAKAEMFKDYVEHSSSTQHRIPAEG
ncbi:unnamed protein product [Spirodela intermedia]|uniref:Uncharacterized protein n=1 Tax=Spirodela intermedia TaxID=51605 RepID=A0A7I8JND8_SPIIN|nr:unnamed protein product [Spirodela intermedia]CAA6671697.1 unnamed protein product [Spirodela intermedia]